MKCFEISIYILIIIAAFVSAGFEYKYNKTMNSFSAIVALGAFAVSIFNRYSFLKSNKRDIGLEVDVDNTLDERNVQLQYNPIPSLFSFIITNKSEVDIAIKYILVCPPRTEYILFDVGSDNAKFLKSGDVFPIGPSGRSPFGYIDLFFEANNIVVETTKGQVFEFDAELHNAQKTFRDANTKFIQMFEREKIIRTPAEICRDSGMKIHKRQQ